MNTVNFTEFHYVVTRETTRDDADQIAEVVSDLGMEWVEPGSVYLEASRFKRRYNVSIGDAFALATAAEVDAPLVAGADDDFDAIEEVPTEPEVVRFREEAD